MSKPLARCRCVHHHPQLSRSKLINRLNEIKRKHMGHYSTAAVAIHGDILNVVTNYKPARDSCSFLVTTCEAKWCIVNCLTAYLKVVSCQECKHSWGKTTHESKINKWIGNVNVEAKLKRRGLNLKLARHYLSDWKEIFKYEDPNEKLLNSLGMPIKQVNS